MFFCYVPPPFFELGGWEGNLGLPYGKVWSFEPCLLSTIQTACIGLMRTLVETGEDSSSSSPEVTSSSSFRQLFVSLLPGILSRLARVALEPTLLHSGIKVGMGVFTLYLFWQESLLIGVSEPESLFSAVAVAVSNGGLLWLHLDTRQIWSTTVLN